MTNFYKKIHIYMGGKKMISIEYALDKYTDLIHAQQKIDLNYFKNELNTEDYKEFLDEIKNSPYR